MTSSANRHLEASFDERRGEPFPKPKRRDGKEPCGECHLPIGETCDICGASWPKACATPDAQSATSQEMAA